MSIDDYMVQRSQILHDALSAGGESFEEKMWVELGVANRHIQRVDDGKFPLRVVSREIEDCFSRVRTLIAGRKNE